MTTGTKEKVTNLLERFDEQSKTACHHNLQTFTIPPMENAIHTEF